MPGLNLMGPYYNYPSVSTTSPRRDAAIAYGLRRVELRRAELQKELDDVKKNIPWPHTKTPHVMPPGPKLEWYEKIPLDVLTELHGGLPCEVCHIGLVY